MDEIETKIEDSVDIEVVQPKTVSLKSFIVTLVVILLILIGAIGFGIYYVQGQFQQSVKDAEERGKQAFYSEQQRVIDAQKPPERVDIEIPTTLPRLGNPEARITIVEFADFQCPFCKQFQDERFEQLKTKFINSGQAQFVFYHYAFLGKESKQAAQASYCAQDQGKFWEYHDLLYANQKGENQGTFSDAKLLSLAQSLKLDMQKFSDCFTKTIHLGEIEQMTSVAKKAGISGTPAITINGKLFVGVEELEVYEQAINEIKNNN